MLLLSLLVDSVVVLLTTLHYKHHPCLIDGDSLTSPLGGLLLTSITIVLQLVDGENSCHYNHSEKICHSMCCLSAYGSDLALTLIYFATFVLVRQCWLCQNFRLLHFKSDREIQGDMLRWFSSFWHGLTNTTTFFMEMPQLSLTAALRERMWLGLKSRREDGESITLLNICYYGLERVKFLLDETWNGVWDRWF